MNDSDKDALPPLAELFLHIVLFVLPRDSFDCDRHALLRLCRTRRNLVEQMHQCSGAFSLDLHMSAKHIVMVSPYPCSQLADIDMQYFRALKSTAARFRSIDRLCINLGLLPFRCNFVNTPQILDLVSHCLTIGQARHLHISHAIFEADQFTNCMKHLFQCTKNRILTVDLRHCKLTMDSKFLRELASMRNLTSLTLDGNTFDLSYSAFPSFSDKLECLSVAGCPGIRPSFLKKISKTLRTLVWSENVLEISNKQDFLEWLTDSRLRNLDIDNCQLCLADSVDFQTALQHMPELRSLSMAGNYLFQDDVFWWIYDVWRSGRLQSTFFSVHISNMHICYPDAGIPMIMSTARFGYVEIASWD
jgi:hypothetical protein